MRIALVGATGQLGTELQQQLPYEIVPLGHDAVELTRPESVAAAIEAHSPQAVINAAAYNLVDRAEDEPEAAFRVNALGPRTLAQICSSRDLVLVHVSSDYVFSGRDPAAGVLRSIPYRETDCPDPQSAYGVSKLAGESFVRSLCPRHFVIRTCGLYGPVRTPGSGNFVQTMLRLGRERGQVRVVNDQICTPTPTVEVARAIGALLQTEAWGLYHASSFGQTTWYDFAREIFRIADMDVDVEPIGSAEFGAKAQRPWYSVLNCDRLAAATGVIFPDWADSLEWYLADALETPAQMKDEG